MQERSASIPGEVIRRYTAIDDAIEMVGKAWRWHGEGKIVIPAKITTNMSGGR